MSDQAKKLFCCGCRDDFYNKPGNSTAGECWRLKSAKTVTRYRLGWWTRPTEAGAFTKVETLNCHYEPGRFAFKERLPDFAVGVRDETGGTA